MSHEEVGTSRRLIAVYARVSTARQEEEETVKTQLVAIREFAAQNRGLLVCPCE